MSKLAAKPPISGQATTFEGCHITESVGGELVSLAFAQGEEKSASALFKKHLGKTLPAPNQSVKVKGGIAIWSAPDQILLLLDTENINADKDIAARFESKAYTTLQTDGWACIQVSGNRVHDVFERFTALDLRRKPVGFAARTSAHHVSVIVVKFGETDYRLLTPRSSARSFMEALLHTAENALITL